MSGRFSGVEQALRDKDEVSLSRTQHHASVEIRSRDLAIKSPASTIGANGARRGIVLYI